MKNIYYILLLIIILSFILIGCNQSLPKDEPEVPNYEYRILVLKCDLALINDKWVKVCIDPNRNPNWQTDIPVEKYPELLGEAEKL